MGRDIFTISVLRTERVKVPEWEGEIILREMSAAQVVDFIRFISAQAADDPGSDMRRAAWTLVTCWVDEDGNQVLTVEDIDMLLETQPAALLNRLSTLAGVLSGMLPDAAAVAEKNSESRQSVESGII